MEPLTCVSGNDVRVREAEHHLRRASMEPLTCVSGNATVPSCRGCRGSGFNGAAHLRERKLRVAVINNTESQLASMEPLTCVSGNPGPRCRWWRRLPTSFNGAAHLRERKPAGAVIRRHRRWPASMEPLTCVSGNRDEGGRCGGVARASMEPLTCVSGNVAVD